MQRPGRPAYRRTRRTAALVVTGAVAVGALTGAGSTPSGAAPAQAAPAAFTPGTGTAIALAYKVNPIFGSLSFGITAGESVAAHQNTGAQAQSKAVNLGVIGVTLAGEGCKGANPTLPSEQQPQPVVVASDEPGADKGRTADLLGAIAMRARATTAPFSEAVTTVAPLGDPSVALISGGRSTATSGLVRPGVREARAVSELAEVRLLNGLVVLKGLRWEAVQRTGDETVNTGTFSLGALTVGGQTVALPEDSTDVLDLLQDTLGALGLTIKAPVVRFEQGIVFVDPFTIGIVPSALRDGVLGSLLTALSPVRDAVTQTILELGCQGSINLLGNNSGTAITVLDLALASFTGAGSLTLELGGVQATTAAIEGFEGLGQLPPSTDLGAIPDLGGTTGLLPSGDLPGLPPSLPVGGDADTGGDEDVAAPRPISDVADGDRGGWLLLIGAGGLAALLATAEADRRKMRRAQRAISLED